MRGARLFLCGLALLSGCASERVTYHPDDYTAVTVSRAARVTMVAADLAQRERQQWVGGVILGTFAGFVAGALIGAHSARTR